MQYIDNRLPILFLLVNLLSAGRYPSDAMIHIAGHFKLTQKSAVVESVINVVISAILVPFFGIAGVLVGTIISSFYRTNYLILYVNKQIIGRKPTRTYLCWGINFAVFALITFLSRLLTVSFGSYGRIFAFCVPYAIGVTAVYFLIISLCMPEVFLYVLGVCRKMVKKERK